LANAGGTENDIVPGHEAVAEKSNERTAIPELFKTLDFAGPSLTIDAAGTPHSRIPSCPDRASAEAMMRSGGRLSQ